VCRNVGLRKVTDDMKTHKNPALRDQPAGKPTPSAKPSIGAKPQPQKAPAHPPKCALESNKWIVVSVLLLLPSSDIFKSSRHEPFHGSRGYDGLLRYWCWEIGVNGAVSFPSGVRWWMATG